MQIQTFKNAILNNFFANLSDTNNDGVINPSLAAALINEVGGEAQFLKLHSKIASGLFKEAETGLTDNKIVNFFINHHSDVLQRFSDCMQETDCDYVEIFYQRVYGLPESEITQAMYSKPSLASKKTKGLKAVAWAMIEVCLTDLSIRFEHYQNELFQSALIC